MVEDEIVEMIALVDWMVVKSELRVLLGGGTVTLGLVEVLRVDIVVELGSSSVMVALLQDLQHRRW